MIARSVKQTVARGAKRMTLTSIPVNDLRRGWIAESPEAQDAVARVLSSGWYVRGPEHDAFENELARYLSVQHAVAVASGTDALTLAMQALGLEPGSEIAMAANSAGYAAIAAAQAGYAVVYTDVDPHNLVMTAAALVAAIGPATRAVVVTHLYGNVADMKAIVDCCRSRNILIIEDCAQSVGAPGSVVHADVAALSFYPTKNLGAAGDAGAVLTNDAAIADRARALREYGWQPKYTISVRGGRNSRMDEVQAALLRIGLRQLHELTDARLAILRRYAAVVDMASVELVTGASCETVAHLAVVRTPARDRLRDVLHVAGIASDIHYPVPDHRQPALPPPSRPTALPVTELAASEVLTLPCFPGMTDSEIDRVAEVLRGFDG